MTDREIYTRWLRHYNAMETAYLRGELTLDAYGRSISNMEERLGVNTWSVVRWHQAKEGA